MSQELKPTPRFPIIRRFWKPAAITSTGGAAVAIWYEEIVLYAEEILALIFLPIMAGVIYLLDIFIFKSHTPTRDDLSAPKEKGAK